MPPAASAMTSAAGRAAAVDTAAGQGQRIEQGLELLAWQAGGLECDVEDRPLLLVGFLRRGGTLLVTDHRIQRRDQDRVFAQYLVNARAVDLEPGDGAIGQQA